MHTVDTPVDTPPQTQLSCHPRLNRSFQSCHAWPPAGNRRGGLPARCQEQAKSNAQSKGFLLSVALPARCQEQAKTRSLSVALPARCQGNLLPARRQQATKTRRVASKVVSSNKTRRAAGNLLLSVVLPARRQQALISTHSPQAVQQGSLKSQPCLLLRCFQHNGS